MLNHESHAYWCQGLDVLDFLGGGIQISSLNWLIATIQNDTAIIVTLYVRVHRLHGTAHKNNICSIGSVVCTTIDIPCYMLLK